MKSKKIPLRKCVYSQEQFPKKDLIRIVINKQGEIFVDSSGKANGRGVYLKKDLNIIKKVKDTKLLDKIFKKTVSLEVYENLESELNE